MKKYHWHVFQHEKLFEKHPQPHCQTHSESLSMDPWSTVECEISWTLLIVGAAM